MARGSCSFLPIKVLKFYKKIVKLESKFAKSMIGGIKMISQLILFGVLVIIISSILFVIRLFLEIYQYKKMYEVIIKLQNIIEFVIEIQMESDNITILSYNGYVIEYKNYKELLEKYEILIENMLHYYEDYECILKFHERIPIYYEQILNVYNEIRVLKWSLRK